MSGNLILLITEQFQTKMRVQDIKEIKVGKLTETLQINETANNDNAKNLLFSLATEDKEWNLQVETKEIRNYIIENLVFKKESSLTQHKQKEKTYLVKQNDWLSLCQKDDAKFKLSFVLRMSD